MVAPERFDVAVIGAGPAGTAGAIELARRGRRAVVLERQSFPRFHIGESLLPASFAIFERLGVAERIAAAGFVDKFGATFLDEQGSREVVYDFAAVGPRAFHVPRAVFDELLLDRARDLGVQIVQAHVSAVREHADRITVAARGERGTFELDAGFLVDASGRGGVVARALGLRRQDPSLKKAALFAHFSGVPRADGRRGGDIRIVSGSDLGWMWFIPLPDGVTSVGVVLDLDAYEELKAGDPATTFARAAERLPAARRLLEHAEATTAFGAESSFSYGTTRFAGDRWIQAGDAGAFIDPVFSSGVHLALLAGVEAAEAADAVVAGSRGAARALRRYGRVQSKRHAFVKRFVHAFYRPGTRDLFFAPSGREALVRALSAVLAGYWEPSFLDRLRLRAFLALARSQDVVTLVPRMHGRAMRLSADAERATMSRQAP